jgi:hypothetical protein
MGVKVCHLQNTTQSVDRQLYGDIVFSWFRCAEEIVGSMQTDTGICLQMDVLLIARHNDSLADCLVFSKDGLSGWNGKRVFPPSPIKK